MRVPLHCHRQGDSPSHVTHRLGCGGRVGDGDKCHPERHDGEEEVAVREDVVRQDTHTIHRPAAHITGVVELKGYREFHAQAKSFERNA